jgi:hypothetical protein
MALTLLRDDSNETFAICRVCAQLPRAELVELTFGPGCAASDNDDWPPQKALERVLLGQCAAARACGLEPRAVADDPLDGWHYGLRFFGAPRDASA